jgi:hypothetical protein
MMFTPRKIFNFVIATLALNAICIMPTSAATYYVAPSGNNGGSGTEGSPWKTIKYAVEKMQPGDTTYVRAGRYSDKVVFSRSGTASAPIKLLNYPGEFPAIDGGEAGSIGTGIMIMHGSGSKNPIGWIHIEGFEILHFEAAILIRSAHDVTIRRNILHKNSTPKGRTTGNFHSLGIGGNGIRILFDRNRVEGNGSFEQCRTVRPKHCNQDHGMYVAGSNWVITNNLFVNNLAFAIQLAATYPYNPNKHAGREYSGGRNWIIANNTFAYQAYRGAIVLWGPAENTRIENNIFYDNCTECPAGYSNTQGVNGSRAKNTILKNNLVYSSTGKPFIDSAMKGNYSETGTIKANPNLVGPAKAGGNFHLQPTSPAIDKGLTLSEVTWDHEGGKRPYGAAFDIGAYEFGAPPDSGNPPPPPVGGDFPSGPPVLRGPNGEVCYSGF